MRNNRLKKRFAVLAAAALLSGSMPVSAANALTIDSISINKELITVDVSYGGNERITMRIEKAEEGLGLNETTYAVMQGRADENNSVTFEFELPEEKNGEVTTGDYTVYVRAGEAEIVQKSFSYIAEADLQSFIDSLKAADAGISGGTETEVKNSAAEKYAPFFTEEYRAQLMAVGISLDTFNAMSDAVQKNTMYQLHKEGIGSIDTENAKEYIASAFAVSAFNGGNKAEAVRILNSSYADAAAEAIGSYLDDSYVSTDIFLKELGLAEEFYRINTARTSTVLAELEAFSQADEIKSELNKIKGLTGTAQNKAFEYIILTVRNSPVKSTDALGDLLDDAYNQAVAVSGSSISGGKGTGSTGGSGGSGSSGGGAVIPAYAAKGQTDAKAETLQLFNDVNEGHWAYKGIKYLYDNKIISGDGNGGFAPDRNITREEFVKMIVSACGLTVSEKETGFADVEKNSWYEGYVAAAAENGIVKGMSESRFGIGVNITREDIAVIALRAMELLGKQAEKVREYEAFNDEAEISDYALAGVKALYEAGILNGRGDGILAPKAYATRAESAKIIYEILGEGK